MLDRYFLSLNSICFVNLKIVKIFIFSFFAGQLFCRGIIRGNADTKAIIKFYVLKLDIDDSRILPTFASVWNKLKANSI